MSLPVPYKQAETNEQKKVAYLYDFTYEGQHYRFTNFDYPVDLDGVVYTPAAISHGAMDEEEKGLSVTTALADSWLKVFFTSIPTSDLNLTLRRVNNNLPNASADDSFILFVGTLQSIFFKGESVLLAFGLIGINKDTRLPRCFVSKFCQWKLYSGACKVNKAAHTFAGTVTGINWDTKVVTLDITEPSAKYYAYGQFEFAGVSYLVIDSSGYTVTLSNVPILLDIGDSVSVVAGCDKTPTVCTNRFNNLANIGAPGLYTPPKNTAIDGI